MHVIFFFGFWLIVLVHSFYHKFSSEFFLNHAGINISFENLKVMSLHDVIYGWNEVNESAIPSSLDSESVTITHMFFPTSYASYVDPYGALAMIHIDDEYSKTIVCLVGKQWMFFKQIPLEISRQPISRTIRNKGKVILSISMQFHYYHT